MVWQMSGRRYGAWERTTRCTRIAGICWEWVEVNVLARFCNWPRTIALREELEASQESFGGFADEKA